MCTEITVIEGESRQAIDCVSSLASLVGPENIAFADDGAMPIEDCCLCIVDIEETAARSGYRHIEGDGRSLFGDPVWERSVQ